MEYSTLISSGLRHIESSNHRRAASIDSVPILSSTSMIRDQGLVRTASVRSSRAQLRQRPLGPRRHVTEPATTRPRSGALPDIPQDGSPTPTRAVFTAPAAPAHDQYTSYLSLNDSDSEAEAEHDEARSTFLDFSDSASSIAAYHRLSVPHMPLSRSHRMSGGPESFLSISPSPVDADSPVIAAPHPAGARRFLLPSHAALPSGSNGPTELRSTPQTSGMTSPPMIVGEATVDMQSNWREVVDNFMDFQDD